MSDMYAPRQVITPVIGAAAFSANDFVGAPFLIPNPMRSNVGVCLVNSLLLVDKSKQNAALNLFLFSGALAGTYADNGAESITAADLLKCLGVIDIVATDYVTLANGSVTSRDDLGLVIQPALGPIYGLLVTTGTPTYAANALQLTFGFDRGEGS